MTLIVANIEGQEIWMVADSAVTGPPLDLRTREYRLKIAVGKNRALIGFAGDVQTGTRATRAAASEMDHSIAIQLLNSASQTSDVEFSYAYFNADKPLLVRIANGSAENVSTLHLGNHDAFEAFQRIRHGEIDPYAPLTLKAFLIGTKFKLQSKHLGNAIRSMIDLFAWRSEHDVGGWASPYILTSDGAHFCEYCYAVSDPIFDRIVPGSLVPHGTAAEGGSSLSVTEFGNQEGEIVYWPQMSGGTIYQRTSEDYLIHRIVGGPEEFRQKALDKFGKPISIWIGEQPPGKITKVSIMRDKQTGSINLAMNQHENGLTVSAHNLRTPFQSKAGIQIGSITPPSGFPFQVDVSEDRKSASLKMSVEENSIGAINLDAGALETLIYRLSTARADLLEQVPVDGPTSGQEISAQIDPAWRTEKSPISNISGIYLRLRHLGYGWLGFILPDHEAAALGKWLQENSEHNDADGS